MPEAKNKELPQGLGKALGDENGKEDGKMS